jgi:glutathione S-transferase
VRLIGMLDSPYVRRVAISLRLMGLDFAHEPLSVFGAYDAFAAINPVVKAPTLVTDDGVVLMESALILQYAEGLVPPERRLAPVDPTAQTCALRIAGLALAACEKSVQIVYEHNLRPAEKQHAPWLDRVGGQVEAAYRLLEAEVARADPWLFGDRPLQADVTAAVAWRFTTEMLPGVAPARPALAALSARAETTAAFAAFPYS